MVLVAAGQKELITHRAKDRSLRGSRYQPGLFTLDVNRRTHCRSRSEPRIEQSSERKGSLTCTVPGTQFAFLTRVSLNHRKLQACSRQRFIDCDRRGLL